MRAWLGARVVIRPAEVVERDRDVERVGVVFAMRWKSFDCGSASTRSTNAERRMRSAYRAKRMSQVGSASRLALASICECTQQTPRSRQTVGGQGA